MMITSYEQTITWVITIDCSLLLSQHVLFSWCLFFRLEALLVKNYFYCLSCLFFFFLTGLNKLYVLNIINNKSKLFMVVILYKHQLNKNILKIHLSCHMSAHLLDVTYRILLIWFKCPPSPEALPVYSRWRPVPSPLICSTQPLF